MTEELKTVLGFEASQAINTLGKLDSQLDEYTKSMLAAAASTEAYNKSAQGVDATMGQLANASRGLASAQNDVVVGSTKATKSVKATGETVEGAGKKVKKAASAITLSWQSMARIFAIQTIHQAISKVTSAFSDSIKEAQELEIQLAEIQTISPQLQGDFQAVADQVQRLSDEFGISRDIVAEGVYQTLSNQVAEGTEAFTFFAAAAELSVGAVTSADAAVNLLSSTINAYGYNASQAATISGKLFKTIELGRVRGEEFANTYGRVLVIAAQLGVSFDEVSASVATLTITGLRYNDAATLITNTMLKLIRPTDAMKDAFAKMGIVSAEAGIQAFGFQGFLQKLRDTTGDSSLALGELFGRVRAIRGVMGLTGTVTEQYAETLKEIEEAGAGEIFEAKEIIFETNAKKVEIQLNELKNAIVFDFGRDALAAIISVSEAFGGAINIMYGFTAAATAAGLAMAALAAWTFPVTAAILGASAAIGIIVASLVEWTDKSDKAGKIRLEAEVSAIAKVNKAEGELAELRVRNLDKNLASVQQYLAARIAADNRAIENAIVQEDFLSDVLDQQLKDREGAWNNFADAIEDRVEEAADNIAESQKTVFDLTSELDQINFDQSIEGANDLQKSSAANARAAKLIGEAGKAFREGKEDIAASLFKDARAATDLAAASAKSAENAGAEFQARKTLDRLYTTQISLQKQFQKEEQARGQLAAKASQEERARAERVGFALKKLQEIKVFGEDGEFLIPDAATAKDRAKPYIDALIQEFEAAGEKADVFKQLDLQKELAAAIAPFESLIEKNPIDLRVVINESYIDAAFNAIEAQAEKSPVQVAIELTIEQDLEALGIDISTAAARAAAPQAVVESGKEIAQILRDTAALPGLQLQYNSSLEQSAQGAFRLTEAYLKIRQEIGGGIAALKATDPRGDNAQELQTQQQHFDKLNEIFPRIIKNAKDANAAVTGTFDPDAYTQATAALVKYAELLRGIDPSVVALIEQELKDLQVTADALTRIDATPFSETEINTMQQRFDDAGESVEVLKEKVGPEFGQAAFQGATTAAQSANAVARAYDKVRESANAAAIATANVSGPAVLAHYGRYMYRADGGSGPRGTDQVPAWLSRGEYVMNAKSTSKFYSQLVAMNAGKQPIYRAAGGPVTNVSDVNINVNGATAPAQTARETMKVFRREMRRGTSRI